MINNLSAAPPPPYQYYYKRRALLIDKYWKYNYKPDMINRNLYCVYSTRVHFERKLFHNGKNLKEQWHGILAPFYDSYTNIPSHESALIRIRNRYLNQRCYVGRTELLTLFGPCVFGTEIDHKWCCTSILNFKAKLCFDVPPTYVTFTPQYLEPLYEWRGGAKAQLCLHWTTHLMSLR